MLADIAACRAAGAAGVVVGALDRAGRIDAALTADLIAAARPLSVTFHRAFDRVPDPREALERLAALGVDRVLTSGRPGRARDHLPVLAELARRAAGRLIVLAAGGVTPADLPALVAAGIAEAHAGSSAAGPDGRVDPARVRALLSAARSAAPAPG
jgi:copper homeostasis protein